MSPQVQHLTCGVYQTLYYLSNESTKKVFLPTNGVGRLQLRASNWNVCLSSSSPSALL